MFTEKELVKKLSLADNEYYNESDPSMTDQEYDYMKDMLIKKNSNNPYLDNIGSKVLDDGVWKKKKHKISMSSLNKVNKVEEFKSWCQGMKQPTFCLEEKLDGISIDLEYHKGRLQRAITRGDGVIGQDIYDNVVNMENVKNVINNFNGSLRGEIVLLKSNLEIINEKCREKGIKELSNCRNGASGTAVRSSGEFSEYLTVIYFDISSSILSLESQEEKMNYIKSLGLQTAFQGVFEIDKIKSIYEDYISHARENLNYEIDGLVIKVNDIKTQESFGLLNNRPKGQVAWKFPNIEVTTILKDVNWSMGKNKRITPIAILDNVVIGDVNVKKSTLHNLDIFKSLDLYKDSVVVVSRRNDVIPYVERVVSRGKVKLEIPTNCPICNFILKSADTYLTCENKNCEGLQLGNLYKWIKKIGIKGFAEKTINQLYQSKKIKKPSDFYKLKIEDISPLDRLGIKSATKIINSLNTFKNINLSTFIGALNIDGFGERLAEKLVDQGYNTLEKMQALTEKEIIKVESFQEKTSSVFVNGLIDKKETIDNLLEYVNIITIEKKEIDMNGKLKGSSFCFTGAINKIDVDGKRFTRKKMTSLTEDNGGVVLSSVKKDLDYLVLADPTKISTKTKKAESLDVKIISEEDFFSMV